MEASVVRRIRGRHQRAAEGDGLGLKVEVAREPGDVLDEHLLPSAVRGAARPERSVAGQPLERLRDGAGSVVPEQGRGVAEIDELDRRQVRRAALRVAVVKASDDAFEADDGLGVSVVVGVERVAADVRIPANELHRSAPGLGDGQSAHVVGIVEEAEPVAVRAVDLVGDGLAGVEQHVVVRLDGLGDDLRRVEIDDAVAGELADVELVRSAIGDREGVVVQQGPGDLQALERDVGLHVQQYRRGQGLLVRRDHEYRVFVLDGKPALAPVADVGIRVVLAGAGPSVGGRLEDVVPAIRDSRARLAVVGEQDRSAVADDAERVVSEVVLLVRERQKERGAIPDSHVALASGVHHKYRAVAGHDDLAAESARVAEPVRPVRDAHRSLARHLCERLDAREDVGRPCGDVQRRRRGEVAEDRDRAGDSPERSVEVAVAGGVRRQRHGHAVCEGEQAAEAVQRLEDESAATDAVLERHGP